MNQTENLKGGTVVRWVVIIAAAIIIGGLVAGNLSSYVLGTKPTAREQLAKLPEKWEFTATGAITGALAFGDDGTLYAASEDGFVYALDSSGSLQWKFNAGPMLSGPTIGADGTIYVSNKDESTYAINRTGTLQWAMEGGPYADKSIGVSSALDQDRLYTPWRSEIRAIRLRTRQSDWSAGNFQTNGSVAILPNGLIVYPGAGRMDAVDSTGTIVWQYPVMDPPLSADMILQNGGQVPFGNFWLDSGIAVGADGTLYACAVDEPGGERRVNSRLIALTLDGSYKWEFRTKTLSLNRATPVIATDGTVYFGSGDGTLYALSSDGTKRWAVNTNAPIVATILSEDGTVYVLNSATLIAVSPEGKLLTRNPIAGILEPPRTQVIAVSVEQRRVLTKIPVDETVESSPTLAPDGTIYVGSHGGKIVAFAGTHGGLMNSPWPKFQGDLANSGRSRF
jgi:outer membrane protein assembly factor BamB